MSAITTSPALSSRPTAGELASLFRGLGEPARLTVLRRLLDRGPQTVSELVVACGQRQPSVSKHLACLHDCGLVSRERQGRQVVYAVCDPHLAPLLGAAEEVWQVARCGESCSCACCDERT
jgi:DNA-binding transcriptional ArsR family regulator